MRDKMHFDIFAEQFSYCGYKHTEISSTCVFVCVYCLHLIYTFILPIEGRKRAWRQHMMTMITLMIILTKMPLLNFQASYSSWLSLPVKLPLYTHTTPSLPTRTLTCFHTERRYAKRWEKKPLQKLQHTTELATSIIPSLLTFRLCGKETHTQ